MIPPPPPKARVPLSADGWLKARAERGSEFPEDELLWTLPVYHDTEFGRYWTWRTYCNKYSIVRVEAKHDDAPYYIAMRSEWVKLYQGGMNSEVWKAKGRPEVWAHYDVWIKKLDNGRPREHRTFCQALDVVRDYHRKKFGVVELRGNDSVIIQAAIDAKLDEAPRAVEHHQSTRSKSSGPVTALGTPAGSKAAEVEKHLTTEWKGMKQLMKEAETGQTFYNHFNKLAEAGKIEKDGGKYRLRA
jgi:hypothetical protein